MGNWINWQIRHWGAAREIFHDFSVKCLQKKLYCYDLRIIEMQPRSNLRIKGYTVKKLHRKILRFLRMFFLWILRKGRFYNEISCTMKINYIAKFCVIIWIITLILIAMKFGTDFIRDTYLKVSFHLS